MCSSGRGRRRCNGRATTSAGMARVLECVYVCMHESVCMCMWMTCFVLQEVAEGEAEQQTTEDDVKEEKKDEAMDTAAAGGR